MTKMNLAPKKRETDDPDQQPRRQEPIHRNRPRRLSLLRLLDVQAGSLCAKGRSDNRLDKPILRTLDLLPWVVGNLRVARPRFWYSGILHTFILWGFIVLQVRTFNFLLEG